MNTLSLLYIRTRICTRVNSSILHQSIGFRRMNSAFVSPLDALSQGSSLYERREKPNVTAAIGNGYRR